VGTTPTGDGTAAPATVLELPSSLSPSKLSKFTTCPLAFRYSYIDHLPEPPTIHQVRGTLVHAALERLFWEHPAGERSLECALDELAAAFGAAREDEASEWTSLGLEPGEAAALEDEARTLLHNYFTLEDPDAVDVVAVELGLEAEVEDVRVRGVIDRLDRNDAGELVIVDYKTGRAPSERYERGNLVGVHVYALLCELVLGAAPAEVRLLHLREPMSLTAVPTEQARRGHRQRSVAVWRAIERACRTGDFRPRPSALCPSCGFREQCPAFAAGTAGTAQLVS
jgi:putative RecB family exonuclease